MPLFTIFGRKSRKIKQLTDALNKASEDKLLYANELIKASAIIKEKDKQIAELTIKLDFVKNLKEG